MLGKLRQQPGLEQGICFPAECMEEEEGSHFPTQALLPRGPPISSKDPHHRSPGGRRRLAGGCRSSLVPETELVRPKPGSGWPLWSGPGEVLCCVPPAPPRSQAGGVSAWFEPGSSPMLEEVAAAGATTGDPASWWVSLELGSAVAGLFSGPDASFSSWTKKEAGRSSLGAEYAGQISGDPVPSH